MEICFVANSSTWWLGFALVLWVLLFYVYQGSKSNPTTRSQETCTGTTDASRILRKQFLPTFEIT